MIYFICAERSLLRRGIGNDKTFIYGGEGIVREFFLLLRYLDID